MTTAACSAAPGSSASLGQSPAGLEQVPLTIVSSGKTHRFTVEVAASPQEQQTGLMYRQEMARDHGMIFPFDEVRIASFWMKNTYIPLDLIFVRKDGSIANIAENAVPMSLEPIYSDGDVAAVLEINGGESAELGIKAGDKVSWGK
ncbi:DUF192 domain-containing protein [Sphingomonas jaspsi]|uniref:DUF192 domain-containing protein n=1 Tax=Sphingomonas jaspsi TaxID=392409 RepID=UPI0004AE8A02|nr:DUF192 domain-containing protein [Sphingomonas jaspsi]